MNDKGINKDKLSLIIWSVFFVIIVLVGRMINMNSTSGNSNIHKELSIDNYEFVYSDDRGSIYGKTFGDKYLFVLNGNKYYYSGSKLYLVSGRSLKEASFDLDILKITPSMINSLISDNEITNKSYYVSLYDFMNIYDADVPVDGTEANKYNVSINKYFDNGNLYMIKIDLSNYYLFKNLQNTGIITIDLYNQNNVNDFSKEYDGLGVIE